MSVKAKQKKQLKVAEASAAYLVEPQQARHSGESRNPTTLSVGWRRAELGELLTVIRGVSYKKEHASSEPAPDFVPILRATNIQSGLVFEGFVHVPKTYVSDEQYLRLGDIVIAASSGSRSVVGKAAQLTTDWKGSFGTFCFGLRPKPGVNPRYLAWFLQSSEYRNRVSELSAGVNINNLRAQHIEQILIPVAPLDEQQRIVAEIEKQFTRLEAGIAALRRVQANLKRYRAAVLKAACEGRLVRTEAELAKKEGRAYESADKLLTRILTERQEKLTGHGKYKDAVAPANANLPPLPQGWTWATVEQLAAPEPNSITDGPFGSNLKTEHYTASGPRVIRLQNIGDGIYVDEEAHISKTHFEQLQKHHVFANDLVIAGFGENPPRSCIIPTTFGPGIVKADCIRFKPQNEVAVKYVNATLNSEPVRRRTKKMVHGVGRPRLNLGEIKSIVLPIPPLPEQRRIVAEVERLLSVVEDHESVVSANLQRATRLRQAVLRCAFSP